MHAIVGYLIADLLVRRLPESWVEALATGIARLLFQLPLPARRALESNLARVRPDLGAGARGRMARAAYQQFALSLVEFLRGRAPHPDPAVERVSVRGARHLARARAAGRGVIVLSAHVGDWEGGAAYLAAGGPPLHVVARPHPSPWVERFFRLKRRARGVATLGGTPAWRGAARALARGEWVALMGDRAAGRRSPCARAAALARRTGALVLPGVMIRTGPGRYAACFGPPMAAAQCGASPCARALMRVVKRYPSQWLAFEALPGVAG